MPHRVLSSPLPRAAESPVIGSEEALWNLIPYNVPWGTEYYSYKEGTLPGPEGACLFLRSPTPVEKRRTTQACVKCRERKAKCSGNKPSCSRCIARGHVCEYSPEVVNKRGKRAQDRYNPLHPYRRDSDSYSTTSCLDYSDYPASSASSSSAFSPKREEIDDDSSFLPHLPHQDQGVTEWVEASIQEAERLETLHTQQYAEPCEDVEAGYTPHSDAPRAPDRDQMLHSVNRLSSPPVYAPTPLRYTPSLSFLSTADQKPSFANGTIGPSSFYHESVAVQNPSLVAGHSFPLNYPVSQAGFLTPDPTYAHTLPVTQHYNFAMENAPFIQQYYCPSASSEDYAFAYPMASTPYDIHVPSQTGPLMHQAAYVGAVVHTAYQS